MRQEWAAIKSMLPNTGGTVILRGIVLLKCAVGLAGCGVQPAMSANDARQRYEQSSADYRA
jgi:hypothetical protein